MRCTQPLGGLALGLLMGLGAGGASAQDRTTLRWASAGDALTLDPHSQNEGPTNTMNQQLYEPLVNRDPKLKKIPGLAVSWTLVEPTLWEFKLRPDVTFHNGNPFNADDVVFSFNRILSPSSDFKESVNTVTGVTKVDDLTVRVATSAPAPVLPDEITELLMMDREWSEEHDVLQPQDYKSSEETFAVRNANGTGPYRLQSREQDVRTVLVKNERWWGTGTPGNPMAIDEIVYTPIRNAATRVAALLSGELDFVLDPPIQDIERLKSSGDLKVEQTPQVRSIFFGLDVGSEELRSSDVKGKNPFADQRVRRAIYLAIDAEAIKQKLMRGLSVPANTLIPPGVHGYSAEIDKRLPYDTEAATQLLTEAGYPDGFSVKLDCPNDRYINDEPICQAMVAMLSRIGVRVQLDAQPKSLHFPKVQNRQSDFYMYGWGVSTIDAHYVFSFLYATEGSNNYVGYSNPRVDELTAAMASEIDVAKRDAMIREASRIVADEVAYLPLHHQVITWATRSDLDLPIEAQDSPQFSWAAYR